MMSSDTQPLSIFQNFRGETETIPLAHASVPSRAELLETSFYQSETSKISCINEVSQSVDISCVMDSEAELSCPKNRSQSFDRSKNMCETIAESSDGTVMEGCFKEYVESSQKIQQG